MNGEKATEESTFEKESREGVLLSHDCHYNPQEDWLNQKELAKLLQVAPETACRWAKDGKLSIFEHGMIGAGTRKYSRRLVQEYQQIKLEQARNKLRHALSVSEGSEA